jgi:hypothetical protein
MSNNISKIKFILSLLAVTSVAALNPSAYAQNIKPGNVDNFLNRANLNTNFPQVQPRENINLTPSVQKLPDSLKPGATQESGNGGCVNVVCSKPPLPENELRTNTIKPNGLLLNQNSSIRQ